MTVLLVDLQIATRNLAKHTRRNLFLAGAIGVVTAFLVLLGGLTEGMREAMLESATTLMTGHVNIGGFFKITSGTAAPLVTEYEKALAQVRQDLPELDFAAPRGRGWAKGVSETSSMDLILAGIDVRNEPGFRRVVHPLQGSLDDLAQPGTILVFQKQADRFGVKVGDSLTLSAPTTRGASNTADVRVVVIAKDIGLLSAWNAFIPSETLRQLYQLKVGTTGAVQLYLKDPAAAKQVAARVRGKLSAAGYRVMDPDPRPYWEKLMFKVTNEDWVGQKLDVTTWDEEMSFLSWIVTAVRWLGGILVVILLVIVVIGIMNTLAIAIRERTREIGTLRAIGMQRRKVLWLTLLEAGLLGAAGAAAGALGGAGLAALLNAARIAVPEDVQYFLLQDRLHIVVQPASALGFAALITLVTAVASAWPALHAARLRPITAIHHIG